MSYLEEIQEKLSAVIDFENKKMFGAFSFVKDTATFGFVKDGKFYFRTDETSVQKYIDANSEQFNPMKNKGMPYHTIPDSIEFLYYDFLYQEYMFLSSIFHLHSLSGQTKGHWHHK